MFKKQREEQNRRYSSSGGSDYRVVETGTFTYYGINGEYRVSKSGSTTYLHITYDYDELSAIDLLASDVKGYVSRQLRGRYGSFYQITLSRY